MTLDFLFGHLIWARILAVACDKVVGDLGLSIGFPRVFWFLPPLQTGQLQLRHNGTEKEMKKYKFQIPHTMEEGSWVVYLYPIAAMLFRGMHDVFK